MQAGPETIRVIKELYQSYKSDAQQLLILKRKLKEWRDGMITQDVYEASARAYKARQDFLKNDYDSGVLNGKKIIIKRILDYLEAS